MDRQPKLELGPPPGFSSSNDRIRNNMTTQEIVSKLRTMREDFDKLEEVLLSKEVSVNQEIGQLQEKLTMETLAKFNAVAEFKKREEMCEKGKRIQEAHEREIAEMKKKNEELETQVCELRMLKGKLGDENTELRSRLRDLEEEINTLAAFESKIGESEEEGKKNLSTIDELRKEKRKLEEEKCKYHKQVQSLYRKFEKLQGRIVKLEDDTERLTSVDVSGGENSEKELSADEGNLHDNEFGNENMEVPLRRNEDICHSIGAAAGTAQALSKGNKDAQGSSSGMENLHSSLIPI